MDSALTQFEVETFMSAPARSRGGQTGRGEVNRASVKPYDFRRPDKLSKDHVRTLQLVHETFARLLSSSLSAYLRIPVQVHLLDVVQASSDEYVSRISSPSILSLVRLQPLTGNVVLELSVDVAFAILDRLLGGQGSVVNLAREVTDIDLSLLESVCSTVLANLRESWANLVRFEAVIEEMSLYPQFVQRVLANDSVVVFTFHLRVQEIEGTLRLAVPYTTLEPVVGKLNAQLWFASRGAESRVMTDLVREQLERASVLVRVMLGQAIVTVQELSNLQPGDVIALETYMDQDLDICVGPERKFRGRPGLRGNRVAVQVTQIDEMGGVHAVRGGFDEYGERDQTTDDGTADDGSDGASV